MSVSNFLLNDAKIIHNSVTGKYFPGNNVLFKFSPFYCVTFLEEPHLSIQNVMIYHKRLVHIFLYLHSGKYGDKIFAYRRQNMHF